MVKSRIHASIHCSIRAKERLAGLLNVLLREIYIQYRTAVIRRDGFVTMQKDFT